MKRLLPRISMLLGCAALVLLAEDFWSKKPYTEWTDKEAAKILKDSPWSHEVSVTLAGSSSGRGAGRSNRGGGGGGGAMGADGGNIGSGGNNGGGGNSGGVMAGGNGNRGGEMDGGSVGGGIPSILLDVRWQSAQPVREAMIVARYGREKAESEEAKKFLAAVVPSYIVGIVGLPAGMARIPQEQLNEMAKRTTSLIRKGKDPITAVSAQVSLRDNLADIYFLFPKTSEITVDDKEVEFFTKLDRIEVKRKFKLKDMMVGDKLAL